MKYIILFMWLFMWLFIFVGLRMEEYKTGIKVCNIKNNEMEREIIVLKYVLGVK